MRIWLVRALLRGEKKILERKIPRSDYDSAVSRCLDAVIKVLEVLER